MAMHRLDPETRRELAHLLYSSMPLVGTISAAAVVIGTVMAWVAWDPGYAIITAALLVIGAFRVVKLLMFAARFDRLGHDDIIRWELFYGIGAAAFGLAVGALSVRAFQLGDSPGIWMCFGLSMAFCVGIVSRVSPWIVMTSSAVLLIPTVIACLLQPEPVYRMGAGMVVLFWITLRGTSYRLTAAFTERIMAQQALVRQAHQDFLTKLPNRAAFISALSRCDRPVAIIAVDLDGFKLVNDRFGHQAGDELLCQVGARLQDCLGDTGIAARFGGDEFMLLLPRGGRDAALALAEAAVTALAEPFTLAGTRVQIGASAGILVTDDRQAETEALLDQADRALYAAKRAGGQRCCWADAEISVSSAWTHYDAVPALSPAG
ncbi:putative diguanylate cyclase (GGDEF) [Bradyrhizobium sp. ORS 285]|uniref:GGDEF domain-containing protein n=1 Tax=Bradyrhizobium sp. ORS 285 TaxID=115808 RepID=UPI0002408F4F|nr:putative diguanylate cyclase (GGDEF) [Bradyrhizobium sp. ORS 285]SMX56154.1 putative diguanylate cyclase (GGDEF) [Bradyrhizobium sp. ORS 285]